MKSKGFLSVAVIVIVLAILVLIYYLKFEKVPAQQQQQQTTEVQPTQQQLPPPTKEQVEEAKKQLSQYLNNTERQLISLSPEGYDTLKIKDKFTELEVAMIDMRVRPDRVANIPNVIQEFMQDSVMTEKETDRILRLMDRAITGKNK